MIRTASGSSSELCQAQYHQVILHFFGVNLFKNTEALEHMRFPLMPSKFLFYFFLFKFCFRRGRLQSELASSAGKKGSSPPPAGPWDDFGSAHLGKLPCRDTPEPIPCTGDHPSLVAQHSFPKPSSTFHCHELSSSFFTSMRLKIQFE